jgi:hypothetical protein
VDVRECGEEAVGEGEGRSGMWIEMVGGQAAGRTGSWDLVGNGQGRTAVIGSVVRSGGLGLGLQTAW